MRKILIITYYWPPSGGAGVQRWLKFVKYLHDFGWEPVVYTPANPESPVNDISLLKDVPENIEVLKTHIWEPYDLYKKFVGRKKEEKINTGFLTENKKAGITEKISVWLRGNLFIPDARRFWIKPSVEFLSEYLSKHKIDIIASTGPPHSMHLIAMELKKKFRIPWLADFRDPWTNIDFYSDLMLTSQADKKHHRLENEVLFNADAVVSVGTIMSEEFERKYQNSSIKDQEKKNKRREKFFVISNGFDEDDLFKGKTEADKKFSLSHIGSLVKTRNPEIFWKVLSDVVSTNAGFKNDLQIKLVGKVDYSVLDSLEEYNLKKYLNRVEYLNHDEVVKIQQQSQILLLLLNNTPNAKGILTGKFFEYLAANRPILCIGPENGEAAAILSETNTGVAIDFSNEKGMKEIILQYYSLYKSNNLSVQSKNIQKYSRKELTKELAAVLEKLALNLEPKTSD